jgi:hypothetical protein
MLGGDTSFMPPLTLERVMKRVRGQPPDAIPFSVIIEGASCTAMLIASTATLAIAAPAFAAKPIREHNLSRSEAGAGW